MNRTFIALLVAGAVICAGTPALAQGGPAGDPLVCYKARSFAARSGLPVFAPRTGDVVVDAFSTARPEDQHRVDLGKAIGLCAPASLNGEMLVDPASHLESYKLGVTRTRPSQPRHGTSVHQVVNQLGSLVLQVRAERRFLAPTALAVGTDGVDPLSGTTLDRFKCYDAKPARAARGAAPFPKFTPVQTTVTDQFGTRVLEVTRPRRLCAPADLGGADPAAPSDARHLVCYQVRLAATKPRQPKFVATAVSTHPSFGPERLTVGKAEELCLPSFRDPAAGPTPTPTATPGGAVVAIRIEPATRYVNPGGSGTFTAIADLAGGGTEDYTQKVIWDSNNDGVALAANAPGDRGRIGAVNPGVAIVSASDPVSGISSTDGGHDAVFNVPGALLSIAVTPLATALDVGEAKSLVATGTYEGNVTRNITQQLQYTSTIPNVALAVNAEGNRSRVEALSPGVATISARDPITGVDSDDTGENATVTVLGALESITLGPVTKSRPAEQFQNYAATGHYAGGGTKNITQEVTYASSDPAVAVAPNTPGNKGRIETVAPGTTTISAAHPSGITTTAGGNDATLTVTPALTTLLSITMGPTTATRGVGEFQNFTVIGHYEGGGTDNLTQDVVYTSSDPTVVSAPNAAGNKGRVEMVAPGTATVTATYTDPVTQSEISTTDSDTDATITVLGALERITLGPLQATRAANQSLTYTAIGHFGGGTTKNLTQRVTYHSSDEAVASAPNEAGNKSRVLTVSPGVVTISATDEQTGVSTTATGDDVQLTVIGALERITLGPVDATRSPGQIQRYTATGHFGGGITQNLTQTVLYASSDPAVAVCPNADGDRSRVEAVGEGTATISATHPTAGLSTTDTGDDATLTVEP